MKVALLGSGDIFYVLAGKIACSSHKLIALATNQGMQLDINRLQETGVQAECYQDHREMLAARQDIELFLMCSYAPLIEEEAWKKYRFVNIHNALLPRFRGFHGMIWSMINDERYMGYTLFQINEVIDGGPVFEQYICEIDDSMDIVWVRRHLEEHLGAHIVEYLDRIEKGKVPTEQKEEKAIFVTKRKPEDGQVCWDWNKRLVFNHIRALTPPVTPGAYTYYKDKKIVLTRAVYLDGENYFSTPGKIVNITTEGAVWVKCGDGALEISEIIVEGKQMVPGEYFGRVGIQFKEKRELF